MNKKLTLSMDEAVIEAAKEYAQKNGTSLSKLMEKFLVRSMNYQSNYDPDREDSCTPLTDGLVGILKQEPELKEYRDYQGEKHGITK